MTNVIYVNGRPVTIETACAKKKRARNEQIYADYKALRKENPKAATTVLAQYLATQWHLTMPTIYTIVRNPAYDVERD